MSAIEDAAKAYWDAQPSPHAPGLTNGQVIPAVKLATKGKWGGHASMAEAALFHHEFQHLNMTPQDFEHAHDRLAPVSFTYHGRPPSMKEVADLKDATPAAVRAYYGGLPDRHYPHVTSAEMIGALQAADPHAMEHLKRPPVKAEAAYLVHSKERPQEYYSRIAATDSTAQGDTSGTEAPAGAGSSGGGNGPVRGRSGNQ